MTTSTIRVEPIVMQITERSGPLLTRGDRSRRSRDSRSHLESREKTEPPLSVDEPLFRRCGGASVAGNYTGLS